MKSETKNIKEALEHKNVFYFFKRYGLAFVCSNAFKKAVYLKARDDSIFWLRNAPHCLKSGFNGDGKS
jgi:hypothetical protein